MTLREALASPEVRELVRRLAAEEINRAAGRDVLEAPAMPEVSGRGLVAALLSPPVVGWMRSMAREAVAKQTTEVAMARSDVSPRVMAILESVDPAVIEAAERRRLEGARKRVEAQSAAIREVHQRSGTASRRVSRSGAAFLAVLESRQEPAHGEDHRSPTQRAWVALARPQAPPEGARVPDRFRPGLGVVEAAVAAVPPAQRGWRELMLARGFSAETVASLGGDAA
jgi:hypothetical protein